MGREREGPGIIRRERSIGRLLAVSVDAAVGGGGNGAWLELLGCSATGRSKVEYSQCTAFSLHSLDNKIAILVISRDGREEGSGMEEHYRLLLGRECSGGSISCYCSAVAAMVVLPALHRSHAHSTHAVEGIAFLSLPTSQSLKQLESKSLLARLEMSGRLAGGWEGREGGVNLV